MNTTDEREELPRIAVDSIQDWRRIKASYLAAAMAQLEEQLSSTGLAAEREALVAHITEFVDQTFAIARPNVRVNGRSLEDFADNEEEMDAYDEGLDRMIWSLSDQKLRWNEIVAKKRRTVPVQVEGLMNGVLEQQRLSDAELYGLIEDLPEDHMNTTNSDADLGPEVQDTFQKTVVTIEELNQSIPVLQDRAERLIQVTRDVELRKT